MLLDSHWWCLSFTVWPNFSKVTSRFFSLFSNHTILFVFFFLSDPRDFSARSPFNSLRPSYCEFSCVTLSIQPLSESTVRSLSLLGPFEKKRGETFDFSIWSFESSDFLFHNNSLQSFIKALLNKRKGGSCSNPSLQQPITPTNIFPFLERLNIFSAATLLHHHLLSLSLGYWSFSWPITYLVSHSDQTLPYFFIRIAVAKPTVLFG